MYFRLVSTYPETKKIFNLTEDLKQGTLDKSKHLKIHAKRLENAVESILGRINEPKQLQDSIIKLGKYHSQNLGVSHRLVKVIKMLDLWIWENFWRNVLQTLE